jgi:type IV secretory pathway VirJ component
MMKNSVLMIVFAFILNHSNAQQSLPVKEFTGNTDSLSFLYISGDGGMNTFSTNLCNEITKKGYNVAAVNAKSYFWNKKTPDQTTTDITRYLEGYLSKRKNRQLVLVGYSFGADVLPFIINRLPANLQQEVKAVVLISPGASTDFEIHLTDIFGGDKKRNLDVTAEIIRIQHNRTVIIAGSDEKSDYAKNTGNRRYIYKELPGGHHYGDDTKTLAISVTGYLH